MLIIQTTNRLILWNIKQGPASHSILYPSRKMSTFKRLLGVLHESTLGGNGAVPSSNVLPLTDTTVLVGCSDGSLKSYDWASKTVVKSIKGLGSNDWIVQLLSANKYNVVQSGEKKRRILTLTKKGVCYLIELTISGKSVDIEPPLARFTGGVSEFAAESNMQHVPLTYDAHRDLVFWLAAPPKTKNTTYMLVWNLKVLQPDLLQQVGGKNIFKPDPTVTIQIPPYATENASGSTNTTVFPILHASFGEDAIVLATGSYTSGEFHIFAAQGNTNQTSSQVTGTSVTSMALGPLIQAGGLLDFTPSAHIYGIRQAPLLSVSENSLLLITSLGLVFLELPINATSTVDSCHVHFGAGLGSLGKSVLSVQDSSIIYGSLDVLKANPVGHMEAKNPTTVYESPPPQHLSPEFQKALFRLAPRFLTSTSGLYLAVIWPSEFRYEILHIPSLLQKVGSRGAKGPPRNPVVASGIEACGFAWVGDEDLYAVIRDKERMKQSMQYMASPLDWKRAAGGKACRSL